MKLLASFLMTMAAMGASAQSVTALSASSHLTVDSGFGVATLANVGSWEFGLASMYTGVAMRSHLWASAVTKGIVTPAQAQAAHDQLTGVKALLDQSLAACQQDSATGKCHGNRAMAAKFERAAKSAYAKLPADPIFP